MGVREIREFFGVMASRQLKRGTYATTSTYTADAKQLAKANGINALDGAGLLKLIHTRAPEQQQSLIQVAFESDYGRPQLRQLRHQDGGAPTEQRRRPLLGLQRLPAAQIAVNDDGRASARFTMN